MENIIFLKDILEILAYISFIFAIPWALIEFFRTKRKEQLDREYGTYDALDQKYLEFQRLCLEYPYLDVFDIPDAKPVKLNKQQKKEELIAFTMLFSIFERAYLMYYDQSTEIKKKQWSGWKEYIIKYCNRENFRRAWKISGNTFDADFQMFMQELIDGIEGKSYHVSN